MLPAAFHADCRRAAGLEAALRVGLQAFDEVERHRHAARLQIGGVTSVGDDAVDRVRELGGGPAALLDRRVRVEVA